MIIMYVIIAFFVLFVITMIIISIRMAKLRTEELKKNAITLGFGFVDNLVILDQGFALFRSGYSRKAYNGMEGKIFDHPVQIFDYKYTVNTGKNSSTYNQTVCLIKLENKIPEFRITQENLFHKIGDVIGFKDIDFVHHEEFSKKYYLKGKDEAAIRKLFDSGLISFFMNNSYKRIVESRGNHLLVYRHGTILKPQEYFDFVAKLKDMLRYMRVS